MIQVPLPIRSDDRGPHTSFPMVWINPSLVQEIKEAREVVTNEPKDLEGWTRIDNVNPERIRWWRPHSTECILIWWGQKNSSNGLTVAWSPTRLANELKAWQYEQVSMMGR